MSILQRFTGDSPETEPTVRADRLAYEMPEVIEAGTGRLNTIEFLVYATQHAVERQFGDAIGTRAAEAREIADNPPAEDIAVELTADMADSSPEITPPGSRNINVQFARRQVGAVFTDPVALGAPTAVATDEGTQGAPFGQLDLNATDQLAELV